MPTTGSSNSLGHCTVFLDKRQFIVIVPLPTQLYYYQQTAPQAETIASWVGTVFLLLSFLFFFFCNRPLPSWILPPCQNESLCKTIQMEMCSAYTFIFLHIKLIFIWKVLRLDSLKRRHKVTMKWPATLLTFTLQIPFYTFYASQQSGKLRIHRKVLKCKVVSRNIAEPEQDCMMYRDISKWKWQLQIFYDKTLLKCPQEFYKSNTCEDRNDHLIQLSTQLKQLWNCSLSHTCINYIHSLAKARLVHYWQQLLC